MLTLWNDQYEIHDLNGKLFGGSLQEMRYAWDVIFLHDSFFEKKYGTTQRNPIYQSVSSGITAPIRFVQVLEKF